jgi:hypothetical protein
MACVEQDWHVKPAWGAYSWDLRLFPFPSDAMSYLFDRGLHVAVNLHDNNGVVNSEVMFDEFAAYMGYPLSFFSAARLVFCLVSHHFVLLQPSKYAERNPLQHGQSDVRVWLARHCAW